MSDRVRVAVDGWELLPGRDRRGIGRFLEGILPPLADLVDLRLLHRPEELELPDGPTRVPVPRRASRARVRASEVEHLVRLPLDLVRVEHDVAWTPGTMPPMASRQPWVHTLHDLAPLVLGLPGHRWERRRLRATAWRLRHAATVVTPSVFAADEGIRELDLDPRRVVVVPHGAPAGLGPDGPRDPTVVGAPALATVSHRDPRKGLHDALAVARLLPGLGVPHRLHVAGDVGDAVTNASGPVVGHGYVPDLAALFRAADAVLVTSRHEGFGFVALEAMACGVPVVAFDAGAVGEVVADAGVLVPPGDVDAMAAAVASLVRDSSALADAGRAALRRAGSFRWGTAAAAYRDVLEAAGASSRRRRREGPAT